MQVPRLGHPVGRLRERGARRGGGDPAQPQLAGEQVGAEEAQRPREQEQQVVPDERRHGARAEEARRLGLQLIVTGSLIGAVSANLRDDERQLRGGLVATQLLGLAMTRYVWQLEPIASLPGEEVVACIAPTIQRYLTGELEAQSP